LRVRNADDGEFLAKPRLHSENIELVLVWHPVG
jgi:hypothetical protein